MKLTPEDYIPKLALNSKIKKKQGVIGPAGKMGGKKWWNDQYLN